MEANVLRGNLDFCSSEPWKCVTPLGLRAQNLVSNCLVSSGSHYDAYWMGSHEKVTSPFIPLGYLAWHWRWLHNWAEVRTECDNAGKMFTPCLEDSDSWVSAVVAEMVVLVAIFRGSFSWKGWDRAVDRDWRVRRLMQTSLSILSAWSFVLSSSENPKLPFLAVHFREGKRHQLFHN